MTQRVKKSVNQDSTKPGTALAFSLKKRRDGTERKLLSLAFLLPSWGATSVLRKNLVTGNATSVCFSCLIVAWNVWRHQEHPPSRLFQPSSNQHGPILRRITHRLLTTSRNTTSPDAPPATTPLKTPMTRSLLPFSTLHDTYLHSHPSALHILLIHSIMYILYQKYST
jgi:hypothetical protein